MSENPGGSCELCKKKKCKCDRQLPTCGQCDGSSQICKYGEGNKRGIPTGYLGTLEQRLTETEIALFNALSELTQIKGNPTTLMQAEMVLPASPSLIARDTNINKTMRMAEWKDYPLRSTKEIASWREFFAKNEQPLRDRRPSAEMPEHPRLKFSVNQQHDKRSTPPPIERPNFGIPNEQSPLHFPLNDRLGSRAAIQPSTPEGNMIPHDQPSMAIPSHFNGNVQGFGLAEGKPNFNVTASNATREELWKSRPDRLAQQTNTELELTRSQNLAAAFRNKYY